ncbi:G-D-S-L family lipolytic protein [Mucilaginibacter sp. HMF5004]|uniref:SGNH/GDSL hydrolase family protein n=1 Tax=Mucilaginibacter rivuli TaxID=2857527 RepID=UPI001C606BAB|nr:SGNH/GDSL hydrolase family protein [Mucilaginibacter rivuli]MBW4890938.1 G-D-S-L family lipolytic protein [Mucilaginibacter rivuli]
MKNFKNYAYILLAAASIAACKPVITVPTPTTGSADFTRYISVGNSLTAGYADNGLYLSGQLNSYPSIIAAQMQTIGGPASFNQPLFSTAQASGTGYLSIDKFNADGTPHFVTIAATAVRGISTVTGGPLFTKYSGPLDNYGVPGIKLSDITNPLYGNGNPYFERLLPGNGPFQTQYIDFITASSFTFFTNWLGNNDALGYATGGGGGYAGAGVLTDKGNFSTLYTTLITRLTANGAKGACATIPDVTTIPFLTTVTYGAILAGVQKVAPQVTDIYINAADATGAVYAPRKATAADLFTLTFNSSGQLAKIGTNGYGVSPLNPIETQYVLDANEVALVKDYVNSYNNTIKTASASKGLAVFDSFAFLTNIKTNGLLVNGISLNSNFVSGGIFSLDGVHLTPRGYAIVANQFISVINAQYGSNIPTVNVSAYAGVTFP